MQDLLEVRMGAFNVCKACAGRVKGDPGLPARPVCALTPPFECRLLEVVAGVESAPETAVGVTQELLNECRRRLTLGATQPAPIPERTVKRGK